MLLYSCRQEIKVKGGVKMAAVLKAIAKYGSKAVKWVWANKSTILKWLDRGMSVAWIVDTIRQILGL